MSQSLSLYRLQQIDSQVDRVQSRMKVIQQTMENDISLSRCREQALAFENGRQQAEQTLRKAEITVQDQRIKIEQTEANLYSGNVHNPKELQDLQQDVVSLKNHLATLEDRLLEAMLAMEEADKEHQNAQAALKSTQDRWTQQNLALQTEQGELQKELQKLAMERDALAGTISEGNVRLYDQLRQQRRGVAVAGISDNTCDACGSTLTPAQAQAVRSAIEMARCPSCGRILYGN